MLDPAAEVLKTIAAERAETGDDTAEQTLARLVGECEFSINRLRASLPPRIVDRSLRLSSALPHHSFQRFGDFYLLTTYTFGQGGFSPSILLARSSTNQALCDGLSKGFDDLWESCSTRPVGVPPQGAS